MPEFKYGRRPAEPNRPALSFAAIRTAAPAHPASEDYAAALRGGWQMLGNDAYGDCNAVTWANSRRLVTATLTGTPHYPGLDQVLEFYRTQNPGFDPNGGPTDGPGSNADGGMSVQRGLEYLHSTGGPDGVKAVAFAKVDPRNTDEVQAALAIFGSLWLGVLVVDGNQQQFAAGQPWSANMNSQIEGGHAVLAGGYIPDVRFITWGQETTFTNSFWDGEVGGYRLVEEAWVVIWPEHLGSKQFQAGIDVQALARDYQQLTGKVLDLGGVPSPTPAPVVTPPGPAPVPNPSPTPDQADKALTVEAKKFLAEGKGLHRLTHRDLRAALTNWLSAHGQS